MSGSMQMTVKQWRQWAAQRASEAQRVAKAYERQAQAVLVLMDEKGCDACDPLVLLQPGQYGGPATAHASVTHELGCPHAS